MDNEARINAKKQWNTTACGELEGDKSSVEYFLGVERDRYQQQPWQHQYFKFENFLDKELPLK